jgi:methyl-accepting chemotaxis protein
VDVVRTSTSDVARRLSSRLNINRPGLLKLDGRQMPVKVRNLALGGALIEAIPERLTVNAKVSLAVEGVNPDLPGSVTRANDHSALVQFALDAEQTTQLTNALADRKAA